MHLILHNYRDYISIQTENNTVVPSTTMYVVIEQWRRGEEGGVILSTDLALLPPGNFSSRLRSSVNISSHLLVPLVRLI